MLFGFSYFKIAAAGIALLVIVGGATAAYLTVKKIGAQDVVISTQNKTIDELGQQLESYIKLSNDSLSRYESSNERVKALRSQLATYTIKTQDCYRPDDSLSDIFIQLHPEDTGSSDSQ